MIPLNISCKLVSEIPEPLRSSLLSEFSNARNSGLVKMLRNYNRRSAKYYIVYHNTVPLFFFSLQTSCIFVEHYKPSISLLQAARQFINISQDVHNFNSKQDLLFNVYQSDNAKLNKLKTLNDDEIVFELKKLWIAIAYIREQDDPDISDLSIYDRTIPAVELVEFCKCDSKDSSDFWKNFKSMWSVTEEPYSIGEFIFFMYVFPIVTEVASYVGCELVMLYAADSSADSSLIQYYLNHLHLTKPDANIVVNKPMYDIGCKLLLRKIDELQDIYEALHKYFSTSLQVT